jgi:hypothetical protein
VIDDHQAALFSHSRSNAASGRIRLLATSSLRRMFSIRRSRFGFAVAAWRTSPVFAPLMWIAPRLNIACVLRRTDDKDDRTCGDVVRIIGHLRFSRAGLDGGR